jgi:hypothetical protein
MASQIGYPKPTPVRIFLTHRPTTRLTLACSQIGFNQIDLPQYTSYEMLRQQLLMAINEGGEGFAFS